MPGQISNAEKAFRKSMETVGTINDIVGALGILSGPLGVISDGIGLATSIVDTGFGIADIVRSNKNPTEKGLMIAETVLKTIPQVGQAAKAGEFLEKAVPIVYNNFAKNTSGISEAGMVRFQQGTNKFLFGM